MRLVLEDQGDTIDAGELAQGDAGIRQTVGAMLARIHVAMRDPLVIEVARAVIPSGDATGEDGDTLYGFMRDGRRFSEDPAGQELLRDPAEQLAKMIHGDVPGMDCDDLAMIACALVGAMRGIAALVVVATTPKHEGGKFHHVFYATASRRTDAPTMADVIPWDPQEQTPPREWPRQAKRVGIFFVT